MKLFFSEYGVSIRDGEKVLETGSDDVCTAMGVPLNSTLHNG